VAARTHSYAEPRRSTARANLAIVFGLAALLAIPLGIELTRKMAGAVLLDAAWAIPVAAIAAVTSLVLERGARPATSRSLVPAGTSRRLQTARVFAVTGICLTLSSALAVGVYEFLLWKEQH
jgi:hypothetical protein